jgi:Asp/Glu/hydantoin racemase
MHIRIICPVIVADAAEETRQAFATLASPGTEVSVVSLAWGTDAIEARADDAWAAPEAFI